MGPDDFALHLILEGKHSVFPPLSMLVTIGFITDALYQVEETLLYSKLVKLLRVLSRISALWNAFPVSNGMMFCPLFY